MKQTPNQMLDEAYDYLSSAEPRKAITVGKKLITMGVASGYEILALAFEQQDDREKALAILEEGTKKAPLVWVLRQLLGNLLSDQGDYDKAMEAYQTALSCHGADASSVHLNIATSLSRQGKYEESNKELLQVDSKEAIAWRESVRFGNLLCMKQFDAIITEAPKVLEEFEADEEFAEAQSDDISRIYARLADAYLDGPKDAAKAAEAARKALRFDSTHEQALAILRRAENKPATADDQIHKVVAEGKWHQPFEGTKQLPVFYSTYWVVAKSDDEALQFVKELEPPEVQPTLKVQESESAPREEWQNLKGVYSRSGHMFADDEDAN